MRRVLVVSRHLLPRLALVAICFAVKEEIRKNEEVSPARDGPLHHSALADEHV